MQAFEKHWLKRLKDMIQSRHQREFDIRALVCVKLMRMRNIFLSSVNRKVNFVIIILIEYIILTPHTSLGFQQTPLHILEYLLVCLRWSPDLFDQIFLKRPFKVGPFSILYILYLFTMIRFDSETEYFVFRFYLYLAAQKFIAWWIFYCCYLCKYGPSV